MSIVQVPRKITFLNALVKGMASEPVWIQKKAELSGTLNLNNFYIFKKIHSINKHVIIVSLSLLTYSASNRNKFLESTNN